MKFSDLGIILDVLNNALNPDDYEERCVARHDADGLMVSTAVITDAIDPAHAFETAVAHADYNEGITIVVATYPNADTAASGHKVWVKLMTTEPLPTYLEDVGQSRIADLRRRSAGPIRYYRYGKEAT